MATGWLWHCAAEPYKKAYLNWLSAYFKVCIEFNWQLEIKEIRDATAVRSVALPLCVCPPQKHWMDTPLTFCGIFGSPKIIGMWSLCIIIINSACFLSLVSFWPKIIVRHAHTHTEGQISNWVLEVSFTSAKTNQKWVSMSVWDRWSKMQTDAFAIVVDYK